MELNYPWKVELDGHIEHHSYGDTQAPEFIPSHENIVDSEGNVVAQSQGSGKCIVACVNAMKDKDPEKFIKLVRKDFEANDRCFNCNESFSIVKDLCNDCTHGKLKKMLEGK